MDELTQYKFLGLADLALWIYATILFTRKLYLVSPITTIRSLGRSPFTQGFFLMGILNLIEISAFVWILYHPFSWIAEHFVYLVFGIIFIRWLIFITTMQWLYSKEIIIKDKEIIIRGST